MRSASWRIFTSNFGHVRIPSGSSDAQKRMTLSGIVGDIFGFTGIIASAPLWYFAGFNCTNPPNDCNWRHPKFQRVLISFGGSIMTGLIALKLAQFRFNRKLIISDGNLVLSSKFSYMVEGISVAVGTSCVSAVLMDATATKFPWWIKTSYNDEYYKLIATSPPQNRWDEFRISARAVSTLGTQAIKSNLIISVVGAVFVLPLSLTLGATAGLGARFVLKNIRI